MLPHSHDCCLKLSRIGDTAIPPPDTGLQAVSLVHPVLTVIAAWWIGTGIVLYLQQRIRKGHPLLPTILIGLSLIALWVLYTSSQGLSQWQSYSGFGAAIVLWGCLELSYFTGLVGGVHRRQCPTDCPAFKRFRLALGASIWHELSVLGTVIVVIALCRGAENPAGLYTFVVLWLMRWSAKLNLFLGVPNFNTDWFPAHMAYAHSYIRRSRVSLFFPLSILMASAAVAGLMITTLSAADTRAIATALPCVLLMLAILEHFFMALPITDSALWNRVFVQNNDASNSMMP